MTVTEALSQTLGSLATPFIDPASRTWWGALAFSAGLTLLLALIGKAPLRLRASLRNPSVKLDLQLLLGSQLLRLLKGSGGVGLAWLLATHLVRRMDAWAGTPTAPELSPTLLTLLYSATLFVAWDASRFAVHWALHRVPLLWRFHQVHHSATVLTPLTYHRVHPVESLLYQGRGALVTGLVAGLFYWGFRGQAQPLTWLGVPAIGLGLNMLVGNLRHSHVWLPYPDWMERWLISPAQHQVHHSAEPQHFDKNFGTWLSVWDRICGSWVASDVPPMQFGLAQPNHSPSLLSAWFAPFAPLPKALPMVSAALLLLSGAANAQGNEDGAYEEEESEEQESEEQETEEQDTANESPGLRMIVRDKQGTPRVAGSAHELTEEDLEQFEYNDIERVLSAQVPGVTTRGEDGYGLRPNIGIRGANAERSAKVSLMEDGVLLAPAPYAAPAAYYFPMSTRMVGLEVFKGPAAIRYGPNTVGGAINLITRPVPLTPELRIDLAGGLRQTGKVHIYGGTSWERGGFLIEGVHLRTAGFKSLPNGGPTGFTHSEAMAKAFWLPAPGQRLELKLGYAGET
ncbi:MAG: sterol desaturase/sphingolipid hydroxylase (fatty acid hydroxylase superfamily), partial [Cognaticolwellia sp.]